MMIFKNKTFLSVLLCLFAYTKVMSHDVLFELKGSFFAPTNDTFKDIYGNCGDFGVEITGNLFDNLYAFTSADFVAKSGYTVSFENLTKINIITLGLGLKYFVPFTQGDFYVGLGMEPTMVSTKNQTPSLLEQSAWVCGGIAKIGFIFDLGSNVFIDAFFNYSFVKAEFYNGTPVEVNQSILNGCLLGVGLGYRFN